MTHRLREAMRTGGFAPPMAARAARCGGGRKRSTGAQRAIPKGRKRWPTSQAQEHRQCRLSERDGKRAELPRSEHVNRQRHAGHQREHRPRGSGDDRCRQRYKYSEHWGPLREPTTAWTTAQKSTCATRKGVRHPHQHKLKATSPCSSGACERTYQALAKRSTCTGTWRSSISADNNRSALGVKRMRHAPKNALRGAKVKAASPTVSLIGEREGAEKISDSEQHLRIYIHESHFSRWTPDAPFA